MQLIESKTLGTAAASIEFTSIPQTFTDLVMVFSLRMTNDDVIANLLVNGATTSLSERFLFGSGSGVGSASGSQFNLYTAGSGRTANTFGSGQVYVPNYASTTTNKSISAEATEENNASTSFMKIGAGLYASNTAITSLGLQNPSGNFVIGSTMSLYGILKGSDGIVTTSP
jgi:hypothetical protein